MKTFITAICILALAAVMAVNAIPECPTVYTTPIEIELIENIEELPELFGISEELERPAIVPRSALEMYDGVWYQKVTMRGTTTLTYYTVWIDLTANIEFFTTPAMGELDTQSMRVSQFVDRYDMDLAINGDGWRPWVSRESVPHPGDDVNITSFQMSDGYVVSHGMMDATIYISADNEASIGRPLGNTQNAISGLGVLLKDGELTDYAIDGDKHPRTIIGLSEDGLTMIWIVIDGRQPLYSDGASLEQCAEIALSSGAFQAVNMDGGGSSTMARSTMIGAQIINSPCDFLQPKWERSIGNQIGLRVTDEQIITR